MPAAGPSPPRRYGAALLAFLVALALSLALKQLMADSLRPSPLFLAAVVLSAWYGGLGPGLLVTALSLLANATFFVPPEYSLASAGLDAAINAAVFAAVAFLVSSLVGALRHAQRQAEADAQRAQSGQDELKAALSAVSDGILLLDPAGRVVFANRMAALLLGFPDTASLMVTPLLEIERRLEISGDDTQAPITRQFPWRLALQGHTPEPCLVCLRPPLAQEDRNLLLEAAPVRDAARRSPLAVATLRDVTETKRAEARERFLVEATAVLASSLDYETTLTSVARLAVPHIADWCTVDIVDEDGSLRPLALEHADAAKVAWARELRQRYPPEPEAARGASHVVRTGQPELMSQISDEQLVAAARDEEHLRLLRQIGLTSYMCVPLRARERILGAITLIATESGRRYGPADLVLAQHLARRSALAIDNARLYREAQAAVRAREEFLLVASHELRTPVTVIQGYTQGLLRLVQRRSAASGERTPAVWLSGDQARMVSNLEKMEYALRRLTALIEEMLDVSRFLRHQPVALAPEHMDLAVLLAAVVAGLRALQSRHRYPINVEVYLDAPAAGVWGQWDRARLQQVLLNLIDNAMKFSPEGGHVTISLGLETNGQGPGAPAGARAHLSVRDQGIGIPLEQQAHIFSPFVRAANAPTRNYPGLGLSLALSKEIVEQHGGRIWVESRGENMGSAFHVVLPGASRESGIRSRESPIGSRES